MSGPSPRLPRPQQRLPRTDRVLCRADFLRIQRLGQRLHTPSFIIMVLPAERTRLGVTVTRKVAGAVGRNRIKRLVREAFRRNRALFPEHCDLVLVARSSATKLDYAAVCAELTAARGGLHRAGAAATAATPTRP